MMKTIMLAMHSLIVMAMILIAEVAQAQLSPQMRGKLPHERTKVVFHNGQALKARRGVEALSRSAGDNVVWGPIIKLSQDAQGSGGNYTPRLAVQGDTVHCVWEIAWGTNRIRLPYIRSTTNGSTWEAQRDLISDTIVSPAYVGWSQTVVNSGKVYIFFVTNDRAGMGMVYFVKSSDRGDTWSSPMVASSDSSGAIFSASVRSATMAAVYVPHINGQAQYPRISRSTDDGGSWTKNPFRMPSSSSNQLRVALTPGLLNFFHPGDMWPGPAPEVVLHRSIDLADTWKDSLVLSPIDTNGSDMPEIATYEYTGCTERTTIGVMWRGEEFGGRWFSAGMAVRLSYDNGTSWQPIQVVSDVPFGSFHAIAVRGNVVAVSWMHEESDFGPFRIKARVSLDEGATWGAVTNLTPTAENAEVPSVTLSASAVHVAWEELIDGKWNIYYCRGELPHLSPALSRTSLDFDTVNVGCSRYEGVMVKNLLSYSLHLSARVSNEEDYSIAPDNVTLCPHDSVVLLVRFAPLSAGDKSAQMILIHNQSDSPDTVLLSAAAEGTGSEFVITDSLGLGWQLVSVPVESPCPFGLPRSFLYERIYRQSDTLVPGRGYWNKLSNAKLSFVGIDLTEDTIPVTARWNLIGSISHPVAVGSIMSDPPGIVTSQFYGYGGSYFTKDSIHPSRAYWVKVSQNGSLILSSSGLVESSSRIRIIPTDELPPQPPDGTAPNREPGTPNQFSLDQNYPNPLNPLTVIRYELPVDGYVTLSVYNVLGQEVATLVDGFQVSGFKSMEWDAREMASGVYFYRLSARQSDGGERERFTDTKKLLILR